MRVSCEERGRGKKEVGVEGRGVSTRLPFLTGFGGKREKRTFAAWTQRGRRGGLGRSFYFLFAFEEKGGGVRGPSMPKT